MVQSSTCINLYTHTTYIHTHTHLLNRWSRAVHVCRPEIITPLHAFSAACVKLGKDPFLCMYVCMYVCICVFVCIFMCVCIYIYIYICTYSLRTAEEGPLSMYVCMYVCTYVCIAEGGPHSVYVCIYVCMYVCAGRLDVILAINMHTDMYICMYVYTYILTYIYDRSHNIIHTFIHSYIHAYIHTSAFCANVDVITVINMHTDIYLCMYMTNTIHTYIHTYLCILCEHGRHHCHKRVRRAQKLLFLCVCMYVCMHT
jgi:hypothetical protein